MCSTFVRFLCVHYVTENTNFNENLDVGKPLQPTELQALSGMSFSCQKIVLGSDRFSRQDRRRSSKTMQRLLYIMKVSVSMYNKNYRRARAEGLVLLSYFSNMPYLFTLVTTCDFSFILAVD